MSISIQTNVNSIVAQENLRVTNEFQSKTIERLTSGYRINASGDDAAGLSVANKFRSDIAELTQGVRNANDGLSQLQIVDGGLNNLTKILDRLKTLATQSASTTFTGDRTILNTEYQDLLLEIDRQAANIGLGSGDTNAYRNNTAISVFIGGGSAQANSKIAIDLSAAANVVNATGLQLTSTGVSGTTSPVAINGASLLTGLYLDTSSTQTYRIATTTGTTSVTVTGGVAGIAGSEVVAQLNAGLNGTGVTFSLNATTGYLQAASSNSFTVAVDLRVGTGAVIQAQIDNAASLVNTGKYNGDGGTLIAVAGFAQSVTFTPAGGSAITVTLAVQDKDLTYNALKTQLAGSGIDVVRIGDEVMFQSTAAFTAVRGTDGGTGGLAGIADGATLTVNAKAASSDVTANAMTSLTALATAAARLGMVQGKVGTGQNKLMYSIALAQSQISNFSTAESRIRDADVAAEAANLTKVQVLSQASMAAMAQANSAPQQVLALLRA
jgi:flagellin